MLPNTILKQTQELETLIKKNAQLAQLFKRQLTYLSLLQNEQGNQDDCSLSPDEQDDLLEYIEDNFRDWATDAAAAATELQAHFNSADEGDGKVIDISLFTSIIAILPDTGGLEIYASLAVNLINYLNKTLKGKPVSLSEFFSTWQNYFSSLIIDKHNNAKKIMASLLKEYPCCSYSDIKDQARVQMATALKDKKSLQQEIMKAWVLQFRENHSDYYFESAMEKGAGNIILILKGMTNHSVVNYHPHLSFFQQKEQIRKNNYGNTSFEVLDCHIDDIEKPKGTINALKHCFSNLVNGKGDLDIGKLEYFSVEQLPFDMRVKITIHASFEGADPPPPGGSSVTTEVVIDSILVERINGKWHLKNGVEAVFKKWEKAATGHPSVKDLKIDTYL